ELHVAADVDVPCDLDVAGECSGETARALSVHADARGGVLPVHAEPAGAGLPPDSVSCAAHRSGNAGSVGHDRRKGASVSSLALTACPSAACVPADADPVVAPDSLHAPGVGDVRRRLAQHADAVSRNRPVDTDAEPAWPADAPDPGRAAGLGIRL